MKTYRLLTISTVVIIIVIITVGMNKYQSIKELPLVEFNNVQRKNQIIQDTCNRKQTYDKSIKIPKEVCIPLEYVISYIYPSVDLNGDGLKDFIVDYNKETLANGDSIFVSIYFQKTDGSYQLAKDLPNIYPIYFKTYEYSKEFEDSLSLELKKIWNIYDSSPLSHFYLHKEKIELWINTHEAHVEYILHYTYSKEKDTWVLQKWEEYTDYNNTIIEREIPEGWKLLIEDFDYIDYLDW